MRQARAQIFLSMAIFGTIGLVRRFIPYSSALVAFSRALIGVLFLLLTRLVGKSPLDFRALRRNLPALSVSGVLLGTNWILLFEAYRFTAVSVATICYYMAPIFLILFSPVLFRERITLKKGACAAVALFGMVLVSGVIETGFSGLRGVLLALGAAAMYAGIVVLNKQIDGVAASDRTVFQLLIAAIALLPYILLTEDFSAMTVTPAAIVMLLTAGVIHTGIAYTLYFGSLPRVPAQTAALISYTDPVVAVLVSAVFLKEALSLPAAIGVVLVLSSAIFSELDLNALRKKHTV